MRFLLLTLLLLPLAACDESADETPRPWLSVSAVPEMAYIEGSGVQWLATARYTGGDSYTYSWATGGQTPPGLALTIAGDQLELAGTCTTPGDYTFTIEVSAAGKLESRQCLIRVAPQTGPLAIYDVMLFGALKHFAYSQDIVATGGTNTGYVWTVAAGALPPGITVGAGPQGGLLSGTPTSSGTYTFTLRVDDSGGAFATADFELAVITHPPSH